jgi:hypothetical protein
MNTLEYASYQVCEFFVRFYVRWIESKGKLSHPLRKRDFFQPPFTFLSDDLMPAQRCMKGSMGFQETLYLCPANHWHMVLYDDYDIGAMVVHGE